MKKLLLFLFATSCSASETITLVSAYSSMSSTRQKHEIMLSNGTFITIKNSLIDISDVVVTVCQKPTNLPVEEEKSAVVGEKRRRLRSQSREASPLARPGELRSRSWR